VAQKPMTTMGRAAGVAAVVALLGGSIPPERAPAALPIEPWEDADWAVFHEKAAWALAQGLDTVPIGAAMARLGRAFVGTPYAANTLEAPGPERVVVDFQGLDCVTFVENVLAVARFIRAPDAAAALSRRGEAEARYEALLTQARYRGGVLSGYSSRLHYFSEWIADGEAKGLVRDVTRELGGVRDTEPVTFMTAHPESYRQLREDPGNVVKVREVEERLSAAGRWYLPEDRIEDAAPRIRDGDIIGATSTLAGMDVAHTGLAIWVDGTLRLMHAPIVGDSVEISTETLPARVRRIRGQDGILVARPCGERPAC
jgi:hypothetical protein